MATMKQKIEARLAAAAASPAAELTVKEKILARLQAAGLTAGAASVPAANQSSAVEPIADAGMVEFLRDVLAPGHTYFGVAIKAGAQTKQLAFDSIEALAAWLRARDAEGFNTYMALATFRGEKGGRVGDNVECVRAFWLDLDCGPGKSYAMPEHAREALDEFCERHGLPEPTLVVSSGRGLHIYWTLPVAVAPEVWLPIARGLKQLCEQGGLDADPSCTADKARILRPVGTSNWKDPTEPLAVSILERGSPIELGAFQAAIERATGGKSRAPEAPAGSNTDLTAGVLDQLHSYLTGLTKDAQFGMLDAAFAAVPDAEWGEYEFWALVAIAGCVNLHQQHGFDREKLIDLLWKHSRRSPGHSNITREAVAEKFDDAGLGKCSIGSAFKLAEQHGFDATSALPVELAPPPAALPTAAAPSADDLSGDVASTQVAPIGPPPLPSKPYSNEPTALRDLQARYVLLPFDGDAPWFDVAKRRPLGAGALNRAMKPWTKHIGKTADALLSESLTTARADSLGYNPGAAALYQEGTRVYANQHVPPPAEQAPTDAERALLEHFLGYLFPRPEDQEFRKYYTQWLGHLVQRPGVKLSTAILMIGDQGVGKTVATFYLPAALVGEENAQVISNKVLRTDFNGFAGRNHLLHFEEVHCSGAWEASDQANGLKSVVSDRVIEVHGKGSDAVNIRNRVAVTASSNARDAMHLEQGDRRWGVYEVRPTLVFASQDLKRRYFAKLNAWFAGPRGSSTLRWLFARVDLSDFDPQRPPPMTAAKMAMTDLSRSPEARVMCERFAARDFPFDRDVVPADWLRQAVSEDVDWNRSSDSRVGIALRDRPFAGFNLGPQRVVAQRTVVLGGMQRPIGLVTGKKHRLWVVRNHAAWKAASNEEISRHLETGAMPDGYVEPAPAPAAPETQKTTASPGPTSSKPAEGTDAEQWSAFVKHQRQNYK